MRFKGHAHLKMVQSLTLTEAYIQLKLLPSLVTVMDPDVCDSFPFYMRPVQSRTGTKITRVGSATNTKSDRSEFVFRPIPGKPRMKRNVWRAIRTHNAPSSSRSHVFTLPCSAAHDPLASGWHMKGAVSRQSSSFCLIMPITRPQSLWNLK